MVEVFKTNITKQKQSKQITVKLNHLFPKYIIDFDLEDCDHILRIENPIGHVNNQGLMQFIHDIGFQIEPLGNDY